MTDLTVGLINNMPDSALAATEAQFRGLLTAAASAPLSIRCTSVPEVPRGADAAAHIAQNYWALEDFMRAPPDALIITGTEPIAADLRDEPYWSQFAGLVDWARSLARPSIWSCLAAHAAVLHLSDIPRRRLSQKCCGIFRHDFRTDHALMRGLDAPLLTPHSRWNDLPTEALRKAGYAILSEGAETGANAFLATEGGASMLFLQGHPEYEKETLLKEYRRDIGRFVRFKQPHYPTLPHGYFPDATVALLEEFRLRAEANRVPKIMSDFPEVTVIASLRNTWGDGAVQLYRNWLQSITAAGLVTTRESAGMLQ